MDMSKMKSEVKKTRKKTASPVSNTPVLVVFRDGSEIARINPNALNIFASEYKLDLRACEACVEKGPHVSHNGFTFKLEVPHAAV